MFTPRYIKHSKLLLRAGPFVMSTGVERSLAIFLAVRDSSTSLRFARNDRLPQDSSFVIRLPRRSPAKAGHSSF
jgi:hypothetical protein